MDVARVAQLLVKLRIVLVDRALHEVGATTQRVVLTNLHAVGAVKVSADAMLLVLGKCPDEHVFVRVKHRARAVHLLVLQLSKVIRSVRHLQTTAVQLVVFKVAYVRPLVVGIIILSFAVEHTVLEGALVVMSVESRKSALSCLRAMHIIADVLDLAELVELSALTMLLVV